MPKGKEIIAIGRRFAVADPICRREMILFFSFFDTATAPHLEQAVDNQKKYGGCVPGIGPGATSIPIVVSVSMDTVREIQSYLLTHQHEGPIRKVRVRNRR